MFNIPGLEIFVKIIGVSVTSGGRVKSYTTKELDNFQEGLRCDNLGCKNLRYLPTTTWIDEGETKIDGFCKYNDFDTESVYYPLSFRRLQIFCVNFEKGRSTKIQPYPKKVLWRKLRQRRKYLNAGY